MRPRSIEGRQFAEAVSAVLGQRRASATGWGGLDATACLDLFEARGIRREIAALFLPWWESGMRKAAEERRKEKEA